MNAFLFLCLTSSVIYSGFCTPQIWKDLEPVIPDNSSKTMTGTETATWTGDDDDGTKILEAPSRSIDELVSEMVQQISNKTISSEIAHLRQEIGAIHENMMEQVQRNVAIHDDDNRKMREVEVNLGSLREELTRQISSLKDEMTNFSTISPPPPSNFFPPLFYQNDNYTGLWFQPSPGWENQCVNMPAYMDKRTKSIILGGHCLYVCAGQFCQKERDRRGNEIEKKCIELPNSYGIDSLEKRRYNDEIRSFRLCQKTY